ncbi:MAG: hypothetical protein U0Z75_02430 [Deinococcaceae bacterium]
MLLNLSRQRIDKIAFAGLKVKIKCDMSQIYIQLKNIFYNQSSGKPLHFNVCGRTSQLWSATPERDVKSILFTQALPPIGAKEPMFIAQWPRPS